METPPPPLREAAPEVPAAIAQAVMAGLAKAPEERAASIAAFRAALLEAGAPDRTGPRVPTWSLDETAVDPEAPTWCGSEASTVAAAPARRKVARWHHVAAPTLALLLSLGATVSNGTIAATPALPGAPPDEPVAVETPLPDEIAVTVSRRTGQLAAILDAAAELEKHPAPETRSRIAAAPEPAPQRQRVAPARRTRDSAPTSPPPLEDTGWVIRR